MRKHIHHWDEKAINFFKFSFEPLARVAFFIVFFWFGFIKLTGASPASEVALALTAKTIGPEFFDILFKITGVIECIIGVLFLVPRAVRIVIPLLFIHILVVSAPLAMVPELTWQAFLVPTLEGQYIIKNVVIVALAFGVAANTTPLKEEFGLDGKRKKAKA